jgi:predicted dehydrogenase
VRALVIGLGRMGRFHSRALRDLGFDVSTVDSDPTAGADYLSVPARDWDAVCVATPIDTLAEQAAAWGEFRGNLLVEKPFAASVGEAVQLADTLAFADVAVGYVERFNPQVRALKAKLEGRVLTTGRFVRWSDRPSCDPDLDLRTHDIDLARFLGVPNPSFDVQTEICKRRTVEVDTLATTHRADLMDHDTSPLHAQWHAFLSGQPTATPEDAVAALSALTVPEMAT